MPPLDPESLADEISTAYAHRQMIATPPSARDGFDLNTAYAVEAALARRRRAAGHRSVGRKVGYANKAMWRVLKLETLVWAHIYDDTVHYAKGGKATFAVGRLFSPKIEPEVIFKLKAPLDPDLEPAAVLQQVEWIALGFEIIDCLYSGWTYQPADFVAAYGLHAALIVGTPRVINSDSIPALVDELAQFTVDLSRDGVLVEQGSGKNVLRSPARCLGELGTAITRRSSAEPLVAGDLVSSGSLTTSTPIAAGETWSAAAAGIVLDPITVRTQ